MPFSTTIEPDRSNHTVKSMCSYWFSLSEQRTKIKTLISAGNCCQCPSGQTHSNHVINQILSVVVATYINSRPSFKEWLVINTGSLVSLSSSLYSDDWSQCCYQVLEEPGSEDCLYLSNIQLYHARHVEGILGVLAFFDYNGSFFSVSFTRCVVCGINQFWDFSTEERKKTDRTT